jgi:hypothetical protein
MSTQSSYTVNTAYDVGLGEFRSLQVCDWTENTCMHMHLKCSWKYKYVTLPQQIVDCYKMNFHKQLAYSEQ